ncbi:MAG: primosomal protein N' [Erysipelotrichaceae bacterium]|nr:primosomal protein N' [Erysipelotrichaceae bacterium]
MKLLGVYVTNAALAVDRPFSYIYEEEVPLYTRIEVPFAGKKNAGLVVSCEELSESIEEAQQRLGFKLLKAGRRIDEEPVLNEELFALAKWMAYTTLSPLISCLNVMLPKVLRTSVKETHARMISRIRKLPLKSELTKRQKEVYELLQDGMPAAEARKISVSVISKLLFAGAIELYEEEARYQSETSLIREEAFLPLHPDQEKAYRQVLQSEKDLFYLFGITGSGKTEVYLHLAREVLKQGKQVLILVPEIALTPQMISRVRERFNNVAFYHSELNPQQRYEQYQRVRQQETPIVVGTRSSVFLPFSDLGLIIMDEENDSSYKQDNVPCYDTRKVVIRRAKAFGAKALFASATPSLDAFARAQRGDYELLQLPRRINESLPQVHIIDLNKEIRSRSSYILSRPLQEALRERLEKGEQSIILLNRRGYAPIVKCGSCSATLMCQDCDTALNYHKDEGILKCHQCGRIYRLPERCPKCGQKSLVFYGFGTKRVEEELKTLLPQARVARMDADNTRKKGSHQTILEDFASGKTDILVGTQMIAKGLDFPKVTLVGILNADAGLMHQDYNASKMTFDLLMQAAGRSGRAEETGEVYIQAFNPDHYVLKAVQQQDYLLFYNTEMNYRRKADYPPYRHFLALFLSDEDEGRLADAVAWFEEACRELPYKHYRPFTLNRISGRHRVRILFVDRDLIGMLKGLHELIDRYIAAGKHSSLKADIDPLYME